MEDGGSCPSGTVKCGCSCVKSKTKKCPYTQWRITKADPVPAAKAPAVAVSVPAVGTPPPTKANNKEVFEAKSEWKNRGKRFKVGD